MFYWVLYKVTPVIHLEECLEGELQKIEATHTVFSVCTRVLFVW